MLDSKMAGAVGQEFGPHAPFGARVFCTNAGWRSAEPPSLSAVALHATLTELMLLLLTNFCAGGTRPLGMRLSSQDVHDLGVRHCRSGFRV